MNESKIYRGGVPIRPDVEKLMVAIPSLSAGDVVTHQTIESVIGQRRGAPRYQTIVQSWRARMFREHALQIEAERGVGFRVLTAEQATSSAVSGITKVGRAARRVAAKVEAIDVSDLTPQARQTHQITRRHAHLLSDMARTASREIAFAAPKPVRALPRRASE